MRNGPLGRNPWWAFFSFGHYTKHGLFLGIAKEVVSMTANEISKINAYRIDGLGYKKIAALLGLSVNTVKTYMRRNPLPSASCVCLQCGKLFTQTPHAREKKFCSDACRMAWWRSHQHLIKRTTTEQVCRHCGKRYQTHKKGQQYCSRACYADSMRKVGAEA